MTTPRRPCAFRQSDLAKAIKAAIAAGLHVAGVKVNARGDIEVVTTRAVNRQGATNGTRFDATTAEIRAGFH